MKKNIEKIKSEKTISELLEFGIINIDKPAGPTSFDVSSFVRKKLNLRKTSHLGTLDPKVTGVLPVALNRACKLTGFFIGEDKKYIGIMTIHSDISLDKIKQVIKGDFTGDIMQKPPVKSRVKRQERKRKINYFKILEKQDKNILFEVKCQGGTYIRKLVHDLGQKLEIETNSPKGNFSNFSFENNRNVEDSTKRKVKAHMLELRRLSAGIFEEEHKDYPCVNLYEFEKAVLEYENGNEERLRKIIIPAEIVSYVYDFANVKKESEEKLLTGKPIFNNDLIKISKLEIGKSISVFCDERFIGMYKIVKQGDVFAKSQFVMQTLKKQTKE